MSLSLASVMAIFVSASSTAPIASYADCLEAGNPVFDVDPPICRDGTNNLIGTPKPAASPAPPIISVPFEILVDGDTRAKVPGHGQQLINTAADWKRYWQAVHAGLPTLPPIIPIDFTTASVIGLNLGPELTTGYGLHITNITASATGTQVNVTESTPTITCSITQATSNPYLIVQTSKLTGLVIFHVTLEKHHC